MKTFTYTCLSIYDVCEHNKLPYETVMTAITDSDISFGTNYDTLISSNQLKTILEQAWITNTLNFDNHDEDGFVLISLGS